jgi:hypothetical protein
MDLVREVDYKRVQGAALLAPAEVFEGVRESDVVFKISAQCMLAGRVAAGANGEGRNLLAQLVNKVAEALTSIDARNASIIRWPSRS